MTHWSIWEANHIQPPSGAEKGKVYGKLLPLCGYCVWWICSQLSDGGLGINEVSIWEEGLGTEHGRARMKWTLLIISAPIPLCICQQ